MLIGIDANEANLTTKRVGVNQFAFGLLHALYNISSTHKFVIYLKNSSLSDLPISKPGWDYRVIPFPRLWTQTRLPWDLYTHQPRPDVFLTLTHYAPRWCPVPTIVSIMDLGFLDHPEQLTVKDFNQLKNWTGYSVRKSSKILAISQFTAGEIQKQYQVPKQNITVVYPGYDQEVFKPTIRPQILKKYGIDKPYILFLSSLKPSKNIEGLIKAFKTIVNTPSKSPPNLGGDKGGVRDLILVIAGKKAWLYDQIFSLVTNLGLQDKVIFTGFVPDDDVPTLMSQAQSFVMPSFHEGFGIPVVEAMGCGVPVVVSNVASLPEVAGEAGIYCDPQNINSIASAIKTSLGPDRKTYIKKGLLQARKFTWSKAAQQVLQMVSQL